MMNLPRILLSALMLILLPQLLVAQLPPNQLEQDCGGALSLCGDRVFQPLHFSGAGRNPDEINGDLSCLRVGERNSVWYQVQIETGGRLCFTLTPLDTLDDYDWAVFDLTRASCRDIGRDSTLQVSCNWEFNDGCQGRTGPNGSNQCPGQNEACIPVNAGDTYAICISNVFPISGFTMDFSASSARFFDGTAPEVSRATQFCEGIRLTFSENILCQSVDVNDFQISGPGGPYTVSDIQSVNCDQGSGFAQEFDVYLTPTPSQEGMYDISLTGTINDLCGNAAQAFSQRIFIPQPPAATIKALSPQCEENNQFVFEYGGPTPVAQYQWNFGDGFQSTIIRPAHTYQTSGTYTASLAIEDVNGCRDTATREVIVHPRPQAIFDIPNGICQGESLSINNRSTSPTGSSLATVEWWLGLGAKQTVTAPQVTYPAAGQYRILLRATNNFGCEDTSSRDLWVYPNPEALFLPLDDACEREQLQWRSISRIETGIANDQLSQHIWDLGDGTQITGVELPTHQYDSAGNYEVRLTVVSDKGCRDSLSLPQIVVPTPVLEIQPDTICIGEDITLQSVSDIEGIVSWYSDSTEANLVHIGSTFTLDSLAQPQVYYASIESNQGCNSPVVSVNIGLHSLGVGLIRASDTLVEFPLPLVNFSLDGTITGSQYLWDFGDGNTSDSPTPQHEFTQPGHFPVTLTVSDINGCRYEWIQWIRVEHVEYLHIPSAFSPNGDGYNDTFFVRHKLIQQFSLTIFNRFGKPIFQTNDPDFQWDGNMNEQRATPEGVYIYQVNARDNLGNKIQESGSLTLIR